ncbi:MAG: hypothetical protein M3O30_16995 [Planctomycetota bacterium]|nr:hypothetical protein [Planctomycetota bacterium]
MTTKLDYCPPSYPEPVDQILGLLASIIAISSAVVILYCSFDLRIQMQVASHYWCGTMEWKYSQQLDLLPVAFVVPISALLIAYKAGSCIILCRAALLGVIAGWATCVLM